MLDLNVLNKAITEESSINVILKKNASKLTVTVIPVLKPLTEEADPVVSALYAILAQPICITADETGDINAYVNAQIQAILDARQPAQDQLNQYQQQVAEAISLAKLAEQEAKDKKAKAEAEKAAKKAAKNSKPATAEPAADADADDDDDDTQASADEAVIADEAPQTPPSSAPFNDLFSNLGVTA